MSSGNWPYILNLGNSIIGVAVLAMPFCFKQCGIVLGIVLLLFCTWLTLVSCQLLMKAAAVSRKRSYEFLAYYTFGAAGKFVIEVGMIGLQIGTLIAQIVVIGDLGPAIVSKVLGVENTPHLRTYLIVFLCLCVGLPLGLLKDLRSVSNASTICICFYTVFVFYVLTLSGSNLWTGSWYHKVAFWRPEGLFQTLPIFSLSFGCQTQLFLLYDSLPEPTLKSINGVTSSAVNLCAVAYLLVGFFGYIAFYDKDIGGDIITLFPATFAADMMKLLFVVSIAVTFPLIIFPCRASLYTLLFPQQKQKSYEDIQEENRMPEIHFKFITVTIVICSMITGILVPNVEFILGMNGATMGTLICYIFPALFFVRVMANKAEGKHIAQLVMLLGITILLVSTFATLYTQDKGHTHPVAPKVPEDLAANLENPVLNKPVDLPPGDADSKNEKRVEPPVPDAPIESVDKKEEKPKEKKSEELPKKDGLGDAKVPDKDGPVEGKGKEMGREKKDLSQEVKAAGGKDAAAAVEKKGEEVKVKVKEEVLKEREKKIEENEQKQQVLLERLVEQQEEQKELIKEQKQILQELKEHKDKEHKDTDGADQEGQDVNDPAQGAQQPFPDGQGIQGAQQPVQGGQDLQQPVQGGQGLQQPVQGGQGLQQPVQGGQAGQQPVQGGQAGQQPVQGGQAVQQPVQVGQAGQQPVQGGQGLQQPVQGGQVVQQPVQVGQAGQQPVQGGQAGQQPVQGGQGLQQPVQVGQAGQQPVQGGQGLQQPVQVGQAGQQPVQGGQGFQQPVQGGQGLQQPVQGGQVVQQPVQGGQAGQQPVQGGQGLQQPVQGGQAGQQPALQPAKNIQQSVKQVVKQPLQGKQLQGQQLAQNNLGIEGQQGQGQQAPGNIQSQGQQAKVKVKQVAGQQGDVVVPVQNLNNVGDAKNVPVNQGLVNDGILKRNKREVDPSVDKILKEVETLDGRRLDKREVMNEALADRLVAINKVSKRR
ncbi:putative sodium-coupled neutral amino acid transporter 10 isoform X2 [Haliotis rufescens]|uniref:putative sodium-coupled neutral amino acid transporter 10 isoform X2 n=1 Tax=Haliotis rufescens TaxID=6454 RepID=UPI00201F2184|nr:putative sodium-coupled neutral amino acid transporter 10 isoform X2 [Haliotis rufescens]